MKKPLVIFGVGEQAELAHFYFARDSPFEVVAFTADPDYVTQDVFCGLPVRPFDQVTAMYPSTSHAFFVAVGYSGLNQNRRRIFLEARNLGYQLVSYVSPRATVLTDSTIGENCLILEDNTLQPFVQIGHNVTLWSGNHIGHHSVIRDHCFIASHVVISGGVDVGECCFIGVNATVRDHVRIGENCVIGAGALLLADADPGGVYMARASERSRVPSHRLKKI